MLFAVANKEFEDVRITKEEWPKVKPSRSNLQIIFFHLYRPEVGPLLSRTRTLTTSTRGGGGVTIRGFICFR